MFGIVDVGGGTRGIFGAGVLDYCIDHGIGCDYFIGVSAGSANGASYLAGQRGRNYAFYNDYAFRKEYMSLRNFMRSGSYINLDYIYGTLSNEDGENPLDYDALMANPADMEIVATDAETGEPAYFQKKDLVRDDYSFMKASCCVPGIDKPYPVGDHLYYDGGLSDPIPFRRAFEAGCERVCVILTRPKDEVRRGNEDRILARTIRRRYPKAARAWERRKETYNRQLQELISLEEAGRARIIAPDSIGELRTLSQDHSQLDSLYQKGYACGELLNFTKL